MNVVYDDDDGDGVPGNLRGILHQSEVPATGKGGRASVGVTRRGGCTRARVCSACVRVQSTELTCVCVRAASVLGQQVAAEA